MACGGDGEGARGQRCVVAVGERLEGGVRRVAGGVGEWGGDGRRWAGGSEDPEGIGGGLGWAGKFEEMLDATAHLWERACG
ncbi:hypothetical protein B1218_34610, partial [Pseudomonas ogarae]